jgi:hypothetical protein
MKSTGFFKTVLLTGLFAGLLDLISAYVTHWAQTGKYAAKMLNYIAAGALGLETALGAGNGVQLLGLFFHFFIACSFTVFFFLIFPYVRFLAFNKYLVGMLYAVFVNLVMGQLILRLSRLPVGPFSVSDSIIGWIVFGVVFGIPIVYSTYKYYGRT